MRTTLSIADPLFVSSPNGGGLVFLHKHLLMPLANEDASGLACTADGLLWCEQMVGSRSLRKVSGGRLQTISVSDSPPDLHDVLTRMDSTYVVFTETNQVVHLDADHRVTESWCFGDEPDSVHVNCLAIHNGRLVASMFGRFHAHREYKGATRQAGTVVDVRTGRSLIEGLSQPHSLVSVGGDLWLCNSEDQSVRAYDADYQIKKSVSLPGYTRGLAVGNEYLYVGLSRSRNVVSNAVGEFDSAVIAVLDRTSLDVVGYVPIPYGEIYDIRIAPPTLNVADIMASLWMHERLQQETGREEGMRELEEVQVSATRRLDEVQATAAQRLDEVQAMAAFKLEETRTRATHELAEALSAHKLLQEDDARQIEQLNAEILQFRGDLEKRDGLIDELERQFHRITTSRSWRWTWPIRAAMYLLRGHGLVGRADHIVAGQLRQQLRRLRQEIRTLAVPHATAPSHLPLASVENSKCDVFIWSIIDWNYRIQRPQHLAREFAARGHRVFYISNNFVARPGPGFSAEPLDSDGHLFRIQLQLKNSPAIYYAMPSADAQQQLRAGIGQLLSWIRSRSCLSLVEHPFWLETARVLPNQKLIYDCMDHHAGFAGNSPDVLASESDLMRAADLLVVTSDWLYEDTAKHNPRRLMIRNACQYEHFATQPEHIFRDKRGRKVIGYYGAIAHWIDLDLLEKVARQFSDCLILMVGDDTAGARQRLRHHGNVEFTGEVPYATLPFYLGGFDVCMLPFQVIPLTLATNPVKIYEYLSAGKKVVSIALPEIRQFGDLVRTGADHAAFLEAMHAALAEMPEPKVIGERQQFALGQTWAHRVDELMRGVEALPQPRVSVIVVTYNNLALTRECLRSIEHHSDYSNLEVIVVDNASADDTPAYLASWASQGDDRRVILNADNRGFAAANNQGLAVASGDYLVLLNNDTYVTPGWVATLIAHLSRNKMLGMLGPVTNNIGNEARIDIFYNDMEGMLQAAGDYTARHVGMLTPLRTAAFFCVAMGREVYEKVGPLDEVFGIGFFEDDDYCRRVERAGWTIACADDVFIHHELSASFNKLKHERREALFERNKKIYEEKWGVWLPHTYRSK